MNRPNRISALAGYAAAPDLAWSGWRLRIPGGPVGGQYHGFIAPDSYGWPAGHDEIYREAASYAGLGGLGDWADPRELDSSRTPWQHEWGGLAQREGENLSDHVYRSPGEMRPRANASGGAHVVHGFQRRREAGYAEAPGNYRGVGILPVMPSLFRAVAQPSPAPVVSLPVRAPVAPVVPVILPPAYGATSVVNQVPPSAPGPISTVRRPIFELISVTPSPAPTVAAGPSNFVPSQGQPLTPAGNDPACLALGMNGGPYPNCNAGGLSPIDSMAVGSSAGTAAAAPASSVSDWLDQSTLISSVPNKYLALGAGVALLMFFGKKK